MLCKKNRTNHTTNIHVVITTNPAYIITVVVVVVAV